MTQLYKLRHRNEVLENFRKFFSQEPHIFKWPSKLRIFGKKTKTVPVYYFNSTVTKKRKNCTTAVKKKDSLSHTSYKEKSRFLYFSTPLWRKLKRRLPVFRICRNRLLRNLHYFSSLSKNIQRVDDKGLSKFEKSFIVRYSRNYFKVNYFNRCMVFYPIFNLTHIVFNP